MSARYLDQEPDALVVIPDHPDYVVVGTYSLTSKATGSDSSPSSTDRKGSIRILPFSKLESGGKLDFLLDHKEFEFGIYNIQFHPRHRTLLAAATSNAEILFYDIRASYHQDNGMILQSLELFELGKLMIEDENGDDEALGGDPTIVTQVSFIDECGFALANLEENNCFQILIALTTQRGDTKLIKTILPTHQSQDNLNNIQYQALPIHKQSYDLEAWSVLPILIEMPENTTPEVNQNTSRVLILSGGDDSQIIISAVTLSPDSPSRSEPPSRDLEHWSSAILCRDKRTHEAGVVCITHLDACLLSTCQSPLLRAHGQQLVITGSYDESIRLFLLDSDSPSTGKCTFSLLSEHRLPGSVWRVVVLDAYSSDPSPFGQSTMVDFILLIAAHTAGALIVRLSCIHEPNRPVEWNFEWFIEHSCTEHESMVYAVAAKERQEAKGTWDILSVSFYDKRINEWSWVDKKRPACLA